MAVIICWQVNPFLEAWARARSNNVLGKAIVPIGDIDDISQLKEDQGLSYDPSAFECDASSLSRE